MYKLVIDCKSRTWYLNDSIVCKYWINSPFCFEDCYISWYYISNSICDLDVLYNLIYTSCNIALRRYNPDSNRYIYGLAKSYYDIYKFYNKSTPTIIDVLKLGKLPRCFEEIVGTSSRCDINRNLPYYSLYISKYRVFNIGLQIENYKYNFFYDSISKQSIKYSGKLLTFG